MPEPLITRCPACGTRFQVAETQLHAARGLVRCGQCLQVFAAAPNLDPPESEPAAVQPPEPAPEPPATPESRTDEALLDRLPTPAVTLKRRPTRAAPLRRTLGLLALLLALLALAGQYLWHERARLAHDPAWAELYRLLCEPIDCRLPPRIDTGLIRNHQLVVRSHPQYDQALTIDLLVENQAPFAQPYPLLEIRFADLGGQPVAERRFRPAEYLGGEVDPEGPMPPGQPIQLHLELLNPGPEAVSYRIRFLADPDQAQTE